MKRPPFRFLLPACACLLLAVPASAETAFQFAAPNLRAPDDPDVNGVRFSIFHGKNRSVRGLDMGFLALSETSTLSGVALVLGLSKVTGNMEGAAAFSLINIHTGSDSGLNAAFINRVNATPDGVDFGFVNVADRTTLVDIGGLNISGASTAQLGFVNVTDRIKGVQLGFLNIAENGFLPVFPFFNFPRNTGN